MTKKPTIGKYYDADEQALIESIESDDAQFVSVLNSSQGIESIVILKPAVNVVVRSGSPFSRMDAQERPITYRIAIGSQQGRKVLA